eukprot:1160621-Pelagomonas_calceolata.AAC.1
MPLTVPFNCREQALTDEAPFASQQHACELRTAVQCAHKMPVSNMPNSRAVRTQDACEQHACELRTAVQCTHRMPVSNMPTPLLRQEALLIHQLASIFTTPQHAHTKRFSWPPCPSNLSARGLLLDAFSAVTHCYLPQQLECKRALVTCGQCGHALVQVSEE